MTRNRSYLRKDLEQLSAYMDGELTAREVEKLETRLSQDPALARLWDELRASRALLSSLPRVKPPRNYRLTPEMVGAKTKSTSLPALRFATALAALTFVILVGIDSLMGLPLSGGMMPSAMQSDIVAEREMAAELLPVETMENTEEEGDLTAPAEAPLGEAMDALGEEAEGAIAEEGRAVMGTPLPLEAEKALDEARPEEEVEPVLAPTATQAPLMLEENTVADAEPAEDQFFEPATEVTTRQPISVLRLAEFAFAILTVILILATATVRRRT